MIEFHEKIEFFGVWGMFILCTVAPYIFEYMIKRKPIEEVRDNELQGLAVAGIYTVYAGLINSSRIANASTTIIFSGVIWACQFRNIAGEAMMILMFARSFWVNVCCWEIFGKACTPKEAKGHFPFLALLTSSGHFITDSGGRILDNLEIVTSLTTLWIITLSCMMFVSILIFLMGYKTIERENIIKKKYLILTGCVLCESWVNPLHKHYIAKRVVDWLNDVEYGIVGVTACICFVACFGFKKLDMVYMGYLCPVIHGVLYILDIMLDSQYFSIVRKFSKYLIFVPFREMMYMEMTEYTQSMGRTVLSGFILFGASLYEKYQSVYGVPIVIVIWVYLLRQYQLIKMKEKEEEETECAIQI